MNKASFRGRLPGQKKHIQAIVCAPEVVCALVCPPKLVCVLICDLKLVCAVVCAPKLVCALLCVGVYKFFLTISI